MSGRIAKGRLLLYYLGNGPRTSTAALATVDFCGRKTIEFPHGGEVKDANRLCAERAQQIANELLTV